MPKIPHIKPLPKWVLLFLASIFLFVIYYLIYTGLFGFKTPRRIHLEQRNQRLLYEKEMLQSRIGKVGATLSLLGEREQNVYRTIFGMPLRVPAKLDTSAAYSHNLSHLYNLAYTQSVSYDTIAPIAENITKMTSCVPSIPPVNPTKVQLTSPFGVRSDPMATIAKVHYGVDLAGQAGEKVYATGDGRVAEANVNFSGYGNEVIIDHGFGYKTRYAHLKRFVVHPGQYVRRGDHIGFLGSSGKSTGSHLHYEVFYMNTRVNPVNYFDLRLSSDEFERLIGNK